MNNDHPREEQYLRTLCREELINYSVHRNHLIAELEAARRECVQSAKQIVIVAVVAVLAFIGMTIWAGVADTRRVACESRAAKSLEDAQAEASRQVQEAETRELDLLRKLEQLRERPEGK